VSKDELIVALQRLIAAARSESESGATNAPVDDLQDALKAVENGEEKDFRTSLTAAVKWIADKSADVTVWCVLGGHTQGVRTVMTPAGACVP
jgi:hypothetical protein